jgi:hypothetical protein
VELDRLKNEKKQKKLVIQATQNAMQMAGKQTVRSHLERLLEHNERSMARLEGKRRMWQEIERKQVFATLSALSLVRDVDSFDPSFRGMDALIGPIC